MTQNLAVKGYSDSNFGVFKGAFFPAKSILRSLFLEGINFSFISELTLSLLSARSGKVHLMRFWAHLSLGGESWFLHLSLLWGPQAK